MNKLSNEQVQKILAGNQTFSQLGFSMLMTRLRGVYSRDKSEDSLIKCAGEINSFVSKYGAIMEEDFKIMENS